MMPDLLNAFLRGSFMGLKARNSPEPVLNLFVRPAWWIGSRKPSSIGISVTDTILSFTACSPPLPSLSLSELAGACRRSQFDSEKASPLLQLFIAAFFFFFFLSAAFSLSSSPLSLSAAGIFRFSHAIKHDVGTAWCLPEHKTRPIGRL